MISNFNYGKEFSTEEDKRIKEYRKNMHNALEKITNGIQDDPIIGKNNEARVLVFLQFGTTILSSTIMAIAKSYGIKNASKIRNMAIKIIKEHTDDDLNEDIAKMRRLMGRIKK